MKKINLFLWLGIIYATYLTVAIFNATLECEIESWGELIATICIILTPGILFQQGFYAANFMNNNNEQFRLTKFSYGGDLFGIPDVIVEKMMDEQELQGNKRDASVFEKDIRANVDFGGFTWGFANHPKIWRDIADHDFKSFYAIYPELQPKIMSCKSNK